MLRNLRLGLWNWKTNSFGLTGMWPFVGRISRSRFGIQRDSLGLKFFSVKGQLFCRLSIPQCNRVQTNAEGISPQVSGSIKIRRAIMGHL